MIRESMTAYKEQLTRTRIETPTPSGTEVLLKISHCGVCHSDIHMHDGCFDLGDGNELDVRSLRELPFTLGHEIAGEVVAAGSAAEGAARGQRRAIYPWIGCGGCPTCARGDEHLCQVARHLGIYVDGGYADHVLIPHPRYLLDHEGIDPAHAAAAMCSGLTAYSALQKITSALPGDPIMILGLGGVGMMGLQFARTMFDGPVFAADIDAAKREQALDAGAAGVHDPADREARKAVLKETGGVAAVIDFVGAESSMKFATGIVGKAGQVIVSGLMGGAFSMPIPMFPLRPISIIGTFVGSLPEARAVLELMRSDTFIPIPIDKRPLASANDALNDLRTGKVIGRVVLTP